MIKVIKEFNIALMRMPVLWRVWLILLVFVNMVCPFFFTGSPEAKIVLAVNIVNFVIMMTLFAKLGFVRLLGLGHILWLPMIPWLCLRVGEIGLDNFFGKWLLTVVIIDTVSLVIDATDVIRYIRGERAPY